ncbi:hypothetical protein [Clostridium tetani]|nr:hypothetical protein [Clostridium tetani]
MSRIINIKKFKNQIKIFSNSQSKIVKMLILIFAMLFSVLIMDVAWENTSSMVSLWWIGYIIYFVDITALIEDFNKELKFFLDLRYTRKEFYKNNYIIIIVITLIYSIFLFYLKSIGIINGAHVIPIPIIQGKSHTYIINFLGIITMNIFIVTIANYLIVKERQYIYLIVAFLNLGQLFFKRLHRFISNNIVYGFLFFWNSTKRFYVLLIILAILNMFLYYSILTAYKRKDVN